MNTNINKIIAELREEVRVINAKIDALEAELRCSEVDETEEIEMEEIPFDVPHIEDEELTAEEEAAIEALLEEYKKIFETAKPTNQAVAIASPITINIGNLSMGSFPIDYAAPFTHKRQLKPLEGSDKLGDKKPPQAANKAAFKRFVKNKLRRSK